MPQKPIRQRYPEAVARAIARRSERYKSDPEFRQQVLAWNRKYHQRRRDEPEIAAKLRATNRRYYDKVIKKRRAEETPEAREARLQKRRAYIRAYNARPDVAARIRTRVRGTWRLHRYGITDEQFAVMLATQDRACALCRSPTPGKRPWYVDHDHETGVVRGVLCSGCNTGLGHYEKFKRVCGLDAVELYLARGIARRSEAV